MSYDVYYSGKNLEYFNWVKLVQVIVVLEQNIQLLT